MRILVMGAGAVGGYFGGVLSRSGADVTFVARGQNLEAIRGQGVRVESTAAGDFTVHPPAMERPDGTWKADLALFCVKSYQNEQAMEAFKPAVRDTTTILTLQNGIGGGDKLAKVFGRERVLLGAAYIDAMRKAPGVVTQAGPCRIVFGEESGAETARVREIRDAFQRAGVDAQISRDILKDLWNKLIFICALSGMTCITRASFAEVLDTPETLDLTWVVMREAAEVGRARGIELDGDIVESTMAHFQEFKKELISSMHLDLKAGSPLEVTVINGAVSRMGKKAGVPTPVNDLITACLTVADERARHT